MRVLIDTNIVVDVLQQREPWCKAGSDIFLAVANRIITGCLTAKEITNIYYFARKQFKGENNVDKKARSVVEKLVSLFEIIDTQAVDCKNALGIENSDYEDAVMIASAERAAADCLVTRNPEHFKTSKLPIYDPEAFLKALNK